MHHPRINEPEDTGNAVDRMEALKRSRRMLVSLHDLRKAGVIEKVGHRRGVTWRLKGEADA